MKTETQEVGNQSSSQPVSQQTRPNCYECKYRGSAEYSAHSSCNHPFTELLNGAAKFIPAMFMLKGLKSPIEKKLNLTYSQHGFNQGWFWWPIDFDPTWMITCDGFVKREITKLEKENEDKRNQVTEQAGLLGYL